MSNKSTVPASPAPSGMDLLYRIDVGKRLVSIRKELTAITAGAVYVKAVDDESMRIAQGLCGLLADFDKFRCSDVGCFFFQNCGACGRDPALCNESGTCLFPPPDVKKKSKAKRSRVTRKGGGR